VGTHLVLAGGGHAHLFVLEGLARKQRVPGLRVTLVAQDRQHAYSGMVSGLIGGRYRPDEVLIDLAALARAAGAEFVEAAVATVGPAARAVELADGRQLTYDILSVAVGSYTAGAERPGVRESVLPVKPISGTLAIVPALEQAVAGAAARGVAVVVVGGGAGGVELALNLRARLELLGRADASVTLVERQDRILGDRSDACRRAAEAALSAARVGLVLGGDISALREGRLVLPSGATLRGDVVVWATGPEAPPFLAASGLATDERGYLRVDATLRSVSHPQVFAAGDAASLEGRPDLPKAGVYAVRQGPVLRDNLLAVAAAQPPRRRFRPQRRFLALLNTGDGRAIFSYGDLAATGRWAMALKDRIDRRFMARFRI
jgi:pyridine nucleotide-disulfide oxidoreductase family protein